MQLIMNSREASKQDLHFQMHLVIPKEIQTNSYLWMWRKPTVILSIDYYMYVHFIIMSS